MRTKSRKKITVNCAKTELKSRETEPEEQWLRQNTATEAAQVRRVGPGERTGADGTSLQHCGGATKAGNGDAHPGAGARPGWEFPPRRQRILPGKCLVSHGGDPTVASRLLIAPEAAQRNRFFPEAAGIPWLGSSMKPDCKKGSADSARHGHRANTPDHADR